MRLLVRHRYQLHWHSLVSKAENEKAPRALSSVPNTRDWPGPKRGFVGGGSPIDTGKMVAVPTKLGGAVHDDKGFGAVRGPELPVVAIPTEERLRESLGLP